MFERFTDSARRVLILATGAARTRNCDYVGTEHILLGLVDENDGVAAQTLESLGVCVDALDNHLFALGRDQPPPSADIPFTSNTKKVLAQSLRETSLLGHDHIGTEHLLLALLDTGESTGARLLGETISVDFAQLRQQILRQVAEHRRAPGSLEPKHLTISLNEAEHALCAVAAAEAGEPIEVWMRNTILSAARTRQDAFGTDDGTLPA